MTAGHVVLGMPHEGVGQGALAGAVGPHDGVNFTGRDRQRQSVDDLLAVDFDLQVFDAQGSSGNVTFTFSNPTAGMSYVLQLVQGSTARTYTWPAAVKWPGGTAITVSATNNNVDLVTFFYDGTTYFGSYPSGAYTP